MRVIRFTNTWKFLVELPFYQKQEGYTLGKTLVIFMGKVKIRLTTIGYDEQKLEGFTCNRYRDLQSAGLKKFEIILSL